MTKSFWFSFFFTKKLRSNVPPSLTSGLFGNIYWWIRVTKPLWDNFHPDNFFSDNFPSETFQPIPPPPRRLPLCFFVEVMWVGVVHWKSSLAELSGTIFRGTIYIYCYGRKKKNVSDESYCATCCQVVKTSARGYLSWVVGGISLGAKPVGGGKFATLSAVRYFHMTLQCLSNLSHVT